MREENPVNWGSCILNSSEVDKCLLKRYFSKWINNNKTLCYKTMVLWDEVNDCWMWHKKKTEWFCGSSPRTICHYWPVNIKYSRERCIFQRGISSGISVHFHIVTMYSKACFIYVYTLYMLFCKNNQRQEVLYVITNFMLNRSVHPNIYVIKP